MRKRTRTFIAVGTGGALAAGLLTRGKDSHRALRTVRHTLRRRARHVPGQLHGLGYKLRRRHPDEQVSDLVLADRIRSSIGPIEKQLDLPHIHVMVNDRIAILHGEVSSQHDSERLTAAIRQVSGVKGVESFLHVGLLASDTRPSTPPCPPDSGSRGERPARSLSTNRVSR